MEIWIAIMIFVLGLCCGSFVNMLIYRVAIKYKITRNKLQETNKKRSFCDFCGKQLHWYENIPVVSWVVQKGKTKCCEKKLPVLYPIVEITTGLLFLFNFQFSIFNFQSNLNSFNFQFLSQLLLGFAVIIFLVFSAVFDLKYMILPDFSTVILVAGALVLWCAGYFGDWNYILSAAMAFGFLGLLYLITKGKGMGMGDVKLAIFMGLFLGPEKTVLAFYVAFIVGALFSLVLMILKKANKKTLVSFGPFLILGTFVAWFWGNEIIKFLISNF